MQKKSILSVLAVTVTAINSLAQYVPAKDDVWDVSQGTILILNTDLAAPNGGQYDGRDLIGGLFGNYAPEQGNVLFANGTAEGAVHIIQWRVKKAVAVKSFRLFAKDDPDTGDHGIGTFRLKAKSVGSQTFDTLLYEFAPDHPYDYEDIANHALISANVKPVEAQEFLAEFTTWNGASGASANGPRIIELDGFTDFIGVHPVIRTSETEIAWDSAPGAAYQLQYRENLATSTWLNLGNAVIGNGGRVSVTDKLPSGANERYYRVVPLDLH